MTVAKSCEQDGLIVSFFFFRTDSKRNNPAALMLAIAHGLAVAHPLVREEIDSRIAADRSIFGARLEKQFQELVLQPTTKSYAQEAAADPSFALRDSRLVIIDGLDECGNEEVQLRILTSISSAYQQDPDFPLRFLITSRPEAWVREAFDAPPLLEITKAITLDDTFGPAEDIRRYYIHEFEDICSSAKYRDVHFPDPWPKQYDLNRLVRSSDGQFAYASTAVKFVRLPRSNPLDQLRLILDSTVDRGPSDSPFQALDSLYLVVLRNDKPNPEQILPILAAVIVLRLEGIRTCPAFIELLLGLQPGDVSLRLRTMHSVLDIRGWDDDINVYHTSFTDFLTSEARSQEFYIDISAQRHFVGWQWLQALSRSRIIGYNFDRLEPSLLWLFFTRWIDFCVNRTKPTPGLLDSLQDIDISAFFFVSLDSLFQNESTVHRRMALTPMGMPYEFIMMCTTEGCTTLDAAFSKMITWLDPDVCPSPGSQEYITFQQAGPDPVDSDIVKRFKERIPKCFHAQVFYNPIRHTPNPSGVIPFAVLFGTRTKLEFKLGGRAGELFMRYDIRDQPDEPPILFWITGCYCHNSGSWEYIPYHPCRQIYETACLQAVRDIVLKFCSIDPNNFPSSEDEVQTIFCNLLDTSLLQHCAFEPELFDLCEKFFSYAQGRSLFVMTANESEARRIKLMGWLETCPDSYAHEARALRYQLCLFFLTAHSNPVLLNEVDHFYRYILNAQPDPDKILAILSAIIILPDWIEPSPEIVELLLGFSPGEVDQTLQSMHSILVIRGQKNGIRVCHPSFATYLVDQTRSGDFYVDRSAQHYYLARQWLQAISRSRIDGYSSDQLFKPSTYALFTGWIAFCTALPGPTSGLLDDLQKLDLGALFFCTQVMLSPNRWADITGSYDPTWDGTFSKMVSWLRSSTKRVDPTFMERFTKPPRSFHLKVSSGFPENEPEIIHWTVLVTTCHKTGSELTRRAKKAFLRYASGEGSPPLPVRITGCYCDDSESDATHPGHRAYQAACLQTAKAFVSGYCSDDPIESAAPLDNELYSILRNVLDSSLLQHCAFEPELFFTCRAFLSALERRPPSSLSSHGWSKRRTRLLEWLETCPGRYAREAEAEALESCIMSVFPQGALEDWEPWVSSRNVPLPSLETEPLEPYSDSSSSPGSSRSSRQSFYTAASDSE
ncbi:hypothetical protein V5O48_015336 [Marasmius crinis-equi]|uniref:Nephrocystin 3-like N-terminal domain-containing protein n=1 Tax=Marasmius crinis-equi TaxID=585013 RepID=A0ABR3EV53_9AGAR